MAYNSPFSPFGPTVLVGTSSVQVSSSNNDQPTSYRVKNMLSTTQYFSWKPPQPGDAVQSITVTAPTAGNPSANTIGMLPYSVEIFGGLPGNAWFEADAAGAFEITPGEGL
jgi:hypothetical protein